MHSAIQSSRPSQLASASPSNCHHFLRTRLSGSRKILGASMGLTFYERIGFEGRRPSTFYWRIRYALAHKGIDFDVHPVRFADVEIIRRLSGQHFTPIIDHDGKVAHETWDIANYLEDRFPNR